MHFLLDRRWLGALREDPNIHIVQTYPAFVLVEAETLPASIPPNAAEALASPVITVHGQEVTIPGGEFVVDQEPHTLVRFVGPVAPEWREKMSAAGVEVLFWAPRFGACLRLPAGLDSQAFQATFPFIAGAQPYREEHAQRSIPAQAGLVQRQTGLPSDLYDLICFNRVDRARVEDELRGMGIEVVDSASTKIRVRYSGDLAVLRNLVGVKIVDPARGAVLLNTAPATTASTDAVLPGTLLAALGFPDGSLDGSGQIIAVSDSGLDRGQNDERLHQDFRGRVDWLKSWPVNPSWTDFMSNPGAMDDASDRNSGHGTHVAGLALGSGAASRAKHRGVAPGARLVFQAIEQYVEVKPEFRSQFPSGFYLAGRPLNLRKLFEEAYEQGARIHVNAWGDPVRGQYTNDSFEADLFLHEHPDSLILFAAGNDGVDLNGDRTGDPGTIYAPATAKSVVAIGATEGPLAGAGIPATWASLDASRQRFNNSTDRSMDLAGDPERMALLSSCGPTRDQRIKPDLCAPGTRLAAPRSGMLPLNFRGWGFASPMPHYMYNVGTSMAVGAAGGFMAVLRQAWQQHQNGQAPSGPALKALAVLGAQAVRRRGGSGEESRFFGGFGRLHLAQALPSQQTRMFDLTDGLFTGEVRDYAITLVQPGALKAVLAWYDAPGEALVNDLDLTLSLPGGGQVWGNHPTGQPGAPDRRNTVEVIHLPAAQPGRYILRVVAANIPTGQQAFALAVRLPEGGAADLFEPALPTPSEPAPAAPSEPAREPSVEDSPGIPVNYLHGIGSVYSQRLAEQGIEHVAQLLDLPGERLGEILKVRGGHLSNIQASLNELKSRLKKAPLAMLPQQIILADLGPTPLPGFDPAEWETAWPTLSSLVDCFDDNQLSNISIQQIVNIGVKP